MLGRIFFILMLSLQHKTDESKMTFGRYGKFGYILFCCFIIIRVKTETVYQINENVAHINLAFYTLAIICLPFPLYKLYKVCLVQ